MNERIKELAKQAGLLNHEFVYVAHELELEAFAELVAAAEREAYAKLIEEVGRQTAAAIRARCEK